MTKNRDKQLVSVVSKGDTLDNVIILKLGRDCWEMAFVGQGSKSRSDDWAVGGKASSEG